MKFTATLVTSRVIERPVQKFAPDLVNAEGMAREFLKGHGCVEGDKFEIYETSPVLVRTVEWSKPKDT